MLKADFHIHTKEDPYDLIEYSAREIIDRAASLGFNVLSITNHDIVTYSEELSRYAEKRGILLIPGIEKKINKKHVLIFNITQDEADSISSLADLKRIKREDTLIIAPHPYFLLMQCLGKDFTENYSLFDAVEYCHFYVRQINYNNKMIAFAKDNKIPVVGTSDAHRYFQFNLTYSLVDSGKSIGEVIAAIKKGKVMQVTRPMPRHLFMLTFGWIFLNFILKTLKSLSQRLLPRKSLTPNGKL